MVWLMKNRIFLFVALAALAGCTRTAEKRPLTDATVKVGSAVRDVKLELEPTPPAARGASLLTEESQMSTADYFRMIDSLQGLAEATRDDRISALAKSLYESFYQNQENFTQTTLMASPLPAAIAGEGEEDLRNEALKLEADLNDANGKLSATLKESQRGFPWPRKLQDPTEAVKAIDAYVNWLLGQMPFLKMAPMMEVAAGTGIKTEYEKVRPSLVNLTEGLQGANNLDQSLVVVKRALKQFAVTLKGPQAAKIRQADYLAAQLKLMDNPQDGLGVLVTVWRITPPEDRKSFREVSPKLYDFFRTKTDSQLDCLSKPRCQMPDLGIAKLFIFKELDNYGIDKMREKIDNTARDSLKASAVEAVVNLLPQIPSIVKEKLDGSSAKYYALINSIKKDTAGFAYSHLAKWAKEKFNEPLRGLETTEVFVTIAGKGNIRVRPSLPTGASVRTGAEVLGASLALSQQFLPEEDSPRLQAALLEPLLKLLAIGGFRQAGGKAFPSFLFALDGAPNEIFDLRGLMKGRTSFAVPDTFVSSDSFLMARASAPRTASVGAQAELLRGIARQVRFHRDWEKNIFDTSLGKYQLGELLPEVPGAINRPLFSKDLVFSLALANAAAILQNVIRDLSPALLLLEKGEVLWGNQYKEINGKNVSMVAAMVPIQDGQRSRLIHTKDVARYVLAIDEFMGATEGLEQSQASLLQTKTDEGRSTLLLDFLDARKKLLLFQQGLTNFLAHVAQQKDGSFHGLFTLNRKAEKVEEPLRLEDQVVAIRALLASSARLELPILRWSALDAFHTMNRIFFDPKQQFYAAELTAEGKPGRPAGLPELAMTLQAGQELSGFMTSDSRAQWEKLSSPWLKALQEL